VGVHTLEGKCGKLRIGKKKKVPNYIWEGMSSQRKKRVCRRKKNKTLERGEEPSPEKKGENQKKEASLKASLLAWGILSRKKRGDFHYTEGKERRWHKGET